MSDLETKKRKISNVGILDIRTTSPETIDQIESIDNVGVLVYSAGTAALIPRLNIHNLGSSVEVAADARILSGQVVLNAQSFSDNATARGLVVVGQVIVEPDVTPDVLNSRLGSLVVYGQVFCPRTLLGILESKIDYLTGQLQAYDENTSNFTGTLTLSDEYLKGLADGSGLIVFGQLRMPDVLNNELLSRKLASLQIFGTITCHEENLAAISGRLARFGNTAQITVIPLGFEVVETALRLDADILGALPSKKLTCKSHVTVLPSVTADDLDRGIEEIKTDRFILCPVALKGAMSRKCNVLNTRIIAYEGELIEVNNETLTNDRLNRITDRATIAVFGTLSVDALVDADLFNAKIAAIHNFGVITLSAGLRQLIEAAVQTSDGSIENDETLMESLEAECESADSGYGDNVMVGNAGVLRL